MCENADIEELTNGHLNDNNEWEGTGIFDKLMIAVNENIEGQWNKSRIQGVEYANVYLGSMQSVISQSIEYIFKMKQMEIACAESRESILVARAKLEDENGKVVDDNGNVTESDDPSTQHYWAVKQAEEGFEAAEFATDKAEEDVQGAKWDNHIKQGKLAMELNLKPADMTEYEALTAYKDIPTEVTSEWLNNSIPQSSFELQALKARLEGDVAKNTTIGYTADSFYKVYRSLQELMFTLANAGVIDKNDSGDAGSVYSRILKSMEISMNGQLGVWGRNANIDLNGDSTASQPTMS